MVDLNVQSARREFRALTLIATACSLLAFFGCAERLTWALEVAPVWVVTVFAWVYPVAPSVLVGRLMFFHALVLIVGAHYTYALVPAGRWFADLFGQTRNPYDRLGHFLQGLTPCLMVREAMLRSAGVRTVALASLMGFLAAVAFSAVYEIFEAAVGIALGQGADAFLGTQGFEWDTQADMLSACVGAAFGIFLLGRAHLRSVALLTDSPLLTPQAS